MSTSKEHAPKDPSHVHKELVTIWSKHCRNLETEIEKLKEELRKYRGY